MAKKSKIVREKRLIKTVQKYAVARAELKKIINDIDNATTEDGGRGAFYIYLKKKF